MTSLPPYPAFDGSQPCARVDPDVFFPQPGSVQQEDVARAVCNACAFRTPCLAYALADPEITGVWGGTPNANESPPAPPTRRCPAGTAQRAS